MRRIVRISAMSLLVMLEACAAAKIEAPPTTSDPAPPEPLSEWERRMDPADAQRLAALPALWTRARAATRPRFPAALARGGALLDPTRMLRYPALPPGAYHCRMVKLGAGTARQPAYRVFPTALCFVGNEAETQSFTRQGGSERPSGWLYPDGETRLVLLGTYAGSAGAPPPYGAAGARNAIGVVERIAHFRWRLTLLPTDESGQLTIYDLTPVPTEAQLPETP